MIGPVDFGGLEQVLRNIRDEIAEHEDGEGLPPEAPTRIRAVNVFSRLRSRSRMNSGTRLAIMGIIISSSSAFQRNEDSGTFRRAKK